MKRLPKQTLLTYVTLYFLSKEAFDFTAMKESKF